MSTKNEIPESTRDTRHDRQSKANGSYSFARRLMLFLVVAGFGTMIVFVIWMKYFIVPAMNSESASGASSLSILPLAWLAGLIAAAVLVFKK